MTVVRIETSQCAPAREEAERFIMALAGAPDAAITFQTFDDDEDRKDEKLATVRHGPLRRHWEHLAAMNARGAGVFVMVNDGDGKGRREANVIAPRALFVDDDSGTLTPQALELTPSIIVQSKRGMHAYWKLRSGERLEQFTPAQMALAAALRTDPAVKDTPRVMRLPGFLHMKDRAAPCVVRVLQTSAATYSVKEVIEGYGAQLTPVEAPRLRALPEQRETETVGDVERAARYLRAVPPAVEYAGGDDLGYRVAAHLKRDCALSDRDAFELMAEWNRANSPPWPVADLHRFIANGEKYGKHTKGEQPPRASTLPAAAKPSQLEAAWHSLTEAELTDDPPPETYIAQPRIPERKTTVLSATGGTGKTTWTSALVVRRALGLPDIDGSELKPGESVILTGEDGKVDYLRKFAALRVEMGAAFDPKKIAARVHLLDVSGIPGVEFVRTDFGQFVLTGIPDELAEIVRRRAPRADLIIVETISRFGAGETNDAHGQMVKAGERLCRLTGAAVLLIGHVSQAAGRAGLADQFASRGGTALIDNARSGMVMTALTPENCAKYAPGAHMADEEMDRYVVLTHPKGMGPKAPPLLLERHANGHGAFFRLADLRMRARKTDGASMAQLREMVAGLTAGGVAVTARKLRDRHAEFGMSENRMEAFVDDAIKAGIIVPDRTRKTQGGGVPLVPGTPNERPDWRENA